MKIGKIFDELLLTKDFKSQRGKFISQGYSEEIVDRYIDDFKEIRDKWKKRGLPRKTKCILLLPRFKIYR